MRYLLFFLLTASAFGQAAGPTREVFLRLLAFESNTIPKESFVADPNAPQPVAGTEAPIKDYLNHEGSKVLLVGSEVVFTKSPKIEDLKKPENQLAKVTLPKSGNRFILLFLPDGKEGFRVMPVNDSAREFPLGSYHVTNLSRNPVKLTLEGKSYEFKSAASSLIENPPVQANNHSAMYAYSFINGKWARIGSGLWPNPGQKRAVQLFWDNPRSQKTELRSFRDISPPRPGQPVEAAAAQ